MESGSPALWSALESGVAELEIALARGGLGIALLGTGLAVHVALFVSHVTGAVLAGLTISAAVYYAVAIACLRRGLGVRWLRVLTPGFEVLLPILALWVLVQTEGPAYALGSWVPPQLLCVFLAASILRLDPRVPLAMGTLAALGYGGIWWFVLRPAVAGDGVLLHRADMQAVRVASLVLTGVACSGAVVGLRRAIARASARLRAAELFGKYRLGAEIASGGMGRVLEALYCPEGGFQRRVAVKLVHPHLASDPAFVERFRQEAEIGAHLAHPNIVATLDFGRVGDSCFLAMEYVDGRSLSSILAERRRSGRPLHERLVAWLGQQIASGLDHAHERATDDAGRRLRVVHRDLTPSNVLVDRTGRARLTDFGVARALGDTTGIHTGQLVGKPPYVAPETLRGEVVDTRADLWSLGVVLWEALCNRRLFQRDNEAATLLAVVEGPIPRVADERPECDGGWDPLFADLLCRDRERRLATAAAVFQRLEELAARLGTPTAEDFEEMLATEDEVEELPLDATTEERLPQDPAP